MNMKRSYKWLCLLTLISVMLLAGCNTSSEPQSQTSGNSSLNSGDVNETSTKNEADTNQADTKNETVSNNSTNAKKPADTNTPTDTKPDITPAAPAIEDEIAKLMSEQVEIKLYENASTYTQEMFMELYGNFLVKKFPNISYRLYSPNEGSGGVGLTELLTQGVKLDLVKISGATYYTFMEDHELQDDVSDLVQKYNYDLNNFYPVVLEHMLSFGDGKQIFALPNAVAATGMFYNKDIFDKFAVSYPTDGMTWDEVYDLAQKLTVQEDGIEYLGFQENISFLTITNQLSQSFLDPATNKATIYNDNWRIFIQNFARFHEIPGNEMLPSYNAAMWQEGRVAMAVGSSGGSWNFTFEAPFDWDIVTLPTFKEFPNQSSGLQIPSWAVAKTSEHRDHAFLIAAYIASEEFQHEFAKLGYVPPIKMDNLDEILAVNIPQLEGKNVKAAVPLETAASPFPTNGYQSLIAGEVNNAYRAVARGQKDVNTALREAEEAANTKLEAALGREVK